MASRVVLLSPVPTDSPRGNAVTVARIAAGLRARGLDVFVWEPGADGLAEDIATKPPVLVHAFHAHHTGPLGLSVTRASGVPLVVTLTGTDVSDDLGDPERGTLVRDVLTDPAAKQRGLFEPAYVEALLAEPNGGLTPLGGNELWQLGLLELWLQRQGVAP